MNTNTGSRLMVASLFFISSCAIELKVFDSKSKQYKSIDDLSMPSSLIDNPDVGQEARTCALLINKAYAATNKNRIMNIIFKVQELSYGAAATISYAVAANRAGTTSSNSMSNGMTTTMSSSSSSSTDNAVTDLRITAAIFAALLGAASTFDAWYNFSQRGDDQERLAIARLVHLENAATFVSCAANAGTAKSTQGTAIAQAKSSKQGNDDQKKAVVDFLQHPGPLSDIERVALTTATKSLDPIAQAAVSSAIDAKSVACSDSGDKTQDGYVIAARQELEACTSSILTPNGQAPSATVAVPLSISTPNGPTSNSASPDGGR